MNAFDQDFYGNGLEDRTLSLILTRSSAQAKRTGGWTFADHEALKSAFHELEKARRALVRYSHRLKTYRDAVEDTVCFLADHHGVDLEDLTDRLEAQKGGHNGNSGTKEGR